MAYDSGICVPWITAADLTCDLPDPDTEGIVALSVAAAVEVLFALSGSQFPGSCQDTVRPTSCGCFCGCGGRYRSAYPGRWSNVTDAIELGFDPIKSIGAITIDGVVLNPNAYRLEEEQWLVRQDGNLWPCSQRRDLATTEHGTWSVVVNHGEDPPSMGIIAAKAFACELIKTQVPSVGKCELPKRTQTIARTGLSVVVRDPFEFLNERRTGVYEIDVFLETYNPEDLEGNFAIGIPEDLPTVIRTTT
jgi:hypothetical protein